MPKNNITKRKDGRWQYKYTDSNGARKSMYSYKNELKRDFSRRCDELDKSLSTKSNGVTLDEIFEQWSSIKFIKTSNDSINTKSIYRRIIQPKFGNREISSITRTELYRYLILVRDKNNYSSSMMSKIKGTFKRPVDWAINELGLNLVNVASNLTLPKSNSSERNSKAIRIYTTEDEERFFNGAKNSKYKNYFKLLLYTGLRPSEALALKWTDIKDNYINIERSITRLGLGDLKTKNAYRQIPISDTVSEILKDQEQINEWLFPAKSGIPNLTAVKSAHDRIKLNTATWRKIGRRYHGELIKAPLEHTIYDFRHTYGTRMAEVGTPDYLLAKLMGHSSASVTKKYYIGITDKMMDSAFDYMDKI